MMKKVNIRVVCITLSLVLLRFIWDVLSGISDLYLVQDVYNNEIFSKYLILNWTRLSCVCALLVNVWTTHLLLSNGQLNVVDRGQKRFNILEIIYLVTSTLTSIVTYIVIENFNLVEVSWNVWSFITTYNIVSVGFFGGSLIATFSLKKDKRKIELV